MHALLWFSAAALAPAFSLAAPAGEAPSTGIDIYKRDNLCNLSKPPALCEPDPTVTVEETAQRAYDFYRAFIVDGDPKTMFSLIDSTYKVSLSLRLRSRNLPPAPCKEV